MFGTPESIALCPQLLLIEDAEFFEDPTDAIEVGDFAAGLGELRRVEDDLPILAAGIIAAENPLEVAFTRGASGAMSGVRMKGVALE